MVAILGFIVYCKYDIENTDKLRSEVTVDFQKEEICACGLRRRYEVNLRLNVERV